MQKLLLITALLAGCATLGPEREGTTERIRSSEERIDRTPGEVLPVTPVWENGVLRAEVLREVACTPVVDEVVQVRAYKERPAQGMGLQLVGSSILIAVGLAATIAYFPLSQQEDPYAPEDQLQPSSAALTAGLLGILGGGYGYYRALSVHQASQPRPFGTARTSTRTKATGPAEACEPEAVDTAVTLVIAGESKYRTFDDGRVRLDFPQSAELCPEVALGEEVTVSWSGAESEGLLWRGTLDDCIRTNLAHDAFAKAQDAINTHELSNAARHFEEGARHVAAIRADYVARDSLVEAARDLRRDLQVGAEEALAQSIDEANRQQDAPFDELYAATSRAVATANLVPGRAASTWVDMLKLSVAAVERPADLDTILSDPRVAKCTDGTCDAMSAEDFEALLGTVFAHAVQELSTSATRLKKAARSKDRRALAAAISEEKRHTEWCSETHRSRLEEPCSALFAERRSAWVVLSKLEQEAVRTKAKATSKAWRAQFATCRKVRSGIAAFEGVGRCDATCQQALSRLRADFQRLESFTPAEPIWTATELENVRQDCAKAGCPRCP